MARDYIALVAALRRKAADPAVTDHEREALTAKADELAKAHNIIETRRTREVPTFDELAEHLRKGQRVEFSFLYYHKPTARYYSGPVSYDINLDEDPKQNGDYEFPGEEYE